MTEKEKDRETGKELRKEGKEIGETVAKKRGKTAREINRKEKWKKKPEGRNTKEK